MNIKKVKTAQFAGIKNVEMSFEKGLNLIYGKNEAGKSTIINLIYSVLFQSAALNRSLKTDKEFRDTFFPSERLGGGSGDYADGLIEFSAGSKDYCLYKRWGEKSKSICELSTDGGRIIDPERIDQILFSEHCLKYARGIFSEIVFANQKNSQMLIQSLFSDSPDDMKKSLSDVISRAMLETGGISVELLRQKLQEKIISLSSRWDESSDRPEKGHDIDNPWKKEVGQILEAYYSLREAERTGAEISEFEDRAEKVGKAKDAFNRLMSVYNELQSKKHIDNAISETKQKLQRLSDAERNWPAAEKRLNYALRLKSELEAAKALELYSKTEKLLSAIKAAENNMRPVKDDDLKTAKALERKIFETESKLMKMNISASINLKGQNKAKAVSLASGKAYDLDSGVFRINEAVKITIEDVADLVLSPADTDPEQAANELNRLRRQLEIILNAYGLACTTELESMASEYKNNLLNVSDLKRQLNLLLNGKSPEDVMLAAKTPGINPRSSGEISSDIALLCKDKTLDGYIGTLESGIKRYEADYCSKESLSGLIAECSEKLASLNEQAERILSLPEEFLNINDPENEYRLRWDTLQRLENSMEEARSKLENPSVSSEEINDLIADKKELLNLKKSELKHWRHIFNVFCEVMTESDERPLKELENRLVEYLFRISDNIVLDGLSNDMNVSVYSKQNKMTASILSEGTKETVALAFRLAAIDWLYPDGGGICVLDDPFTDMDEERCLKSCSLIDSFSKRHQVIFFTCDKKYEKLLGAAASEI